MYGDDEEYFNDEEFKEILEEYENTISHDMPVFMDPDDLTDIADYYQMKGRQKEADQAVNRALELEPDALLPLTYMFHKSIACNDLVSAHAFLDRMIDHESPEYVYCQAEMLLAEEKVEQADSYLRQKFGEVPPDEYQDFVLDVANIFTDYGYAQKAMEWMMRARQENTEDFKELMGHTLFGLGKYADSERIFNELIDKNPFQKRYWNALANVQYMNEDYNASISSSEYAIAIDPDNSEGLLSKANGLYRLDNFEEALKFYERYSEQVPQDEYAMMYQGICLINMGQSEEAITRLGQAARLTQPGSQALAEIYQELAFAHSELGQTESALYYLEQTENLDCDHADILVIKGHILLGAERTEEAEEAFRKAIEDSAEAPHIFLRIIVSLYDNEYIEPAYQLFLRFFEIVDDKWNQGYAYMALCCWRTNRTDEFLHYLEEAVRRNRTESIQALSFLFPEGTTPDDYLDYMKQNLHRK